MRHFLIIDIGGTKTTAVVFNDQGEPITDFIVKSSRTYEGEDAVFQNTVELAYEVLEAAGMKATGKNPDTGLVEIVEIPSHPFFIGVQFHPELKSTPEHPQPIFVAFVKAAMQYRDTQVSAKASE